MTLTEHAPFESLIRALSSGRDAGTGFGGHIGTTHGPIEEPLIHLEHLAARPARFGELSRPLPEAVRESLGIDRFWSHQAEAIELLRAGVSVAVATGTASGKSLCYQAPIAEAVTDRADPATAMLLFPTKALAHDQLRALGRLGLPGLVAACYDGDAGVDERSWIRRNANVLLTNPEMLHHGILPTHPRWATFLMRLRYVVIDELHVLRGVFGTHVAQLLRRLRRLCAKYGSEPTFVFSSATIGDPGRLASELVGVPVEAVTGDGSPRGDRLFALWNPPVDERGVRASSNRETADLVAGLVDEGRRTIAFCRSRKGSEIVASDVRRRLPDGSADMVRSYRGGYLADERREIEQQLADGELHAVVATTALELGIDIGGLDACVLDGFPGTIASMWQRAGRAGRAGQESLAVLVAGDDQLDQYWMAHPHEVFAREPEEAVINPANPYVLLPHLAAASHEMPLTHDDERFWPGLLDDGVRQLVLDGNLRIRRRRVGSERHPTAVWDGVGVPTHGVSLRGGGGREFRISDDGDLIGTVDGSRVFSLVHEGAIYLHQGQSWRVTDLDIDDGVALVEKTDGGEYTQPTSEADVRVLAIDEVAAVAAATLTLGELEVVSRVTGFKRRETGSGELLGTEELDLPPTQLVTRGFWYTVSPALLETAGLAVDRWPGVLHAVEHAVIGLLPLFTICDRWDVGGVSTALQADTGLPSIFVYDGHDGGAGIAELGFAAGRRHLEATLDLVRSCRCVDGCPSCVQSPKCGNGNETLDKDGATVLLGAILGEADRAAA